MAAIRKELVYAAIRKVDALIDVSIYNDMTEIHESQIKSIFDDESLISDEKLEAIRILIEDHDYQKVLLNEGTKRLCKECQKDCFATLYCEHCVRTYLINNFSNWTSGNSDIDNLIQECQKVSLRPDKIIEWIPYNKLQNSKYITKGGYSEIYSALWTDGEYVE
ncbi:hypothetical protein GLOIN_2v1470673 [Rhizophagus irregularis DAOM 181602=DAOM 197198]|uniref:Uncharacterized protein n=2 Tax=Rhizophagus irregularis TaxID=588596 RepID=A0A015IVG2_RHIIW|nr:hypothetical protein GLOIN_2v1470673 [Rhizophagus irregularis DAOM 181602=DAOM 197198]EXX58255.1 hypothetical protein RirG_199680 [Rhizophagus irregularis DAOM 197198w]POG81562.1 hypothetical protein GLOIN_2v1470673 [Rhizophagus irregularis DAOM 181602=DAOM 197198]|eukprot:XP_025188428.1 hypothetical protein GLOIN_2v1470673 [Rhizophagus irregularis DAOM 181602=DAOM 197198]